MPDRLDEYRRKRDFGLTAEPSADETGEKKGAGRRFVVQKHDASRLHYDFRLEIGGVLESWAVPKGPSLDPGEKRLAVPTEPHPLSYRDFEGVIPESQYGGGTVLLWDEGTFEPIDSDGETVDESDDELADDLKNGKLRFRLRGEKLRGGFTLVRMKDQDEWLLIKRDDDDADRDGDITEDRPESVRGSGDLEAIEEDSLESPPEHVDPTLCTLVDEVPTEGDWIHELKYDGYRLLARVEDGDVRFESRNRKDWTEKVGEAIVGAIRELAPSAWIDGELVAFTDDGLSSFRAVRSAVNAGEHERLCFMAFDLLFLEGVDLRERPLRWRKSQLEKLLEDADDGPIRYVEHDEGGGEAFHRRACEDGAEGSIAKRADGSYPGKRSKDWLKIRCGNEQEMVVVGYTPSTASDDRIGSLVLAVREGDDYRYAGRVGTGFSDAEREELKSKLDRLSRKTSPVVDAPSGAELRDATWATPKLVAQVKFTEWTEEGRLRHPSYVGLRADKEPEEVVRETPKETEDVEDDVTIRGVRLSSPDKVLYPDAGFTKRDLAEHFSRVAERMLPHVARRPLTLVRCPDGTGDECFYQKHAMKGLPDVVKTVTIEEKNGSGDYLYVEDAEGLVALAQIGALEVHLWGSRIDRLERVDRMVFDLDPGEDVDFDAVIDAARDVRDRLGDLGLESFAMLTGGKGVHVVVPLERHHDFDEVKAFAKALAKGMEADEPDRYIAKASKSEREGKVFVDYLRNGRGATAIAPYSPRAREGAPVAVPVRWDELGDKDGGGAYTMESLPRRLSALKGDPWAGYDEVRQRITADAREAVGADG